MNAKQLLEFALALPGGYEDYPFGPEWAVARHAGNNKLFAMFYVWDDDGGERVNLKCEPMQADFWRGVYAGVLPGYHMNKTHWNTVLLGSDVPDDALRDMVRHSYELTRPKLKRAKTKETETET